MKNETPVQSFGSRGVMNRGQVWKVVGLTLLVCGSLHAQQIKSFDVLLPDGTKAYNTFPTAINLAGVIAGSYQDANTLVYQGFVRSPGNTYTVFDPLGTTDSTNTIVTGINFAGTVTGYYTDASGVVHGFLRASNGQTTTIDDSGGQLMPAAGTSPGQGIFPLGINDAGEITGWYYDNSFLVHGFLRTPGGTFTTIDPPTSLGTFPEAINLRGEIMGIYVSADPVTGLTQVHFFLRTTNGTLTIDPPGLVTANQSDSAGYGGSSLSGFIASGALGSINTAGSVVGYFFDGSGYQGFFRNPGGKFTPINEPQSATAGTPPRPDYTFVNGINPSGKIIGQYLDSTSTAFHGFVRDPGGQYITIDPPNSRLTAATAINTVGVITGWYEDATFPSAIYHGFLRSP